LKRGFDDSDAAGVAAIFLGLLDAAEFATGFAASLFERWARGKVFMRFLFAVELQLFTYSRSR
jgi:hypothetical protein